MKLTTQETEKMIAKVSGEDNSRDSQLSLVNEEITSHWIGNQRRMVVAGKEEWTPLEYVG